MAKVAGCVSWVVSLDRGRRSSSGGVLIAAMVTVLSASGCGGSSPTSPGSGGQGGHASTGSSGGVPGTGGVAPGSGGHGGTIEPGSTGGAGGGAVTTSTGGNGSGGAGGNGGATTGVAGMSAGGSSAGGRNGAGGIAPGGRSGTAGISGTGGVPLGVTTAGLLVDLGKAFCAAARTCCMKAGMATNLGDCETQFPSRLYGLPYYNRGVELIDNDALSACIDGYKSTASTCAFQPLEAACKGVFVGTKSEGAACGQGGMSITGGSGECKPTGRATACLWTGDSQMSTDTGVCINPLHGKKGDPCAGSCEKNESCVFDLFTSPGYPTAECFEEDGLYCGSDGNSSHCTTIVPTGGNCEDDSLACASTDYCDFTGSPAKCRKAATLGQSCSSSDGPNCAHGMSLVCGQSGKCEDLGFAYDRTCMEGAPPFPL